MERPYAFTLPQRFHSFCLALFWPLRLTDSLIRRLHGTPTPRYLTALSRLLGIDFAERHDIISIYFFEERFFGWSLL